MSKYCHNCGRKLEENAKFCSECGASCNGTSSSYTTNNRSQSTSYRSNNNSIWGTIALASILGSMFGHHHCHHHHGIFGCHHGPFGGHWH